MGLSWRDLQLTAGRWRQSVGMVQEGLSAGPTIWSTNSRPMPKIKIETVDFVALPLTRDWLSVRAGLAHGWFEGGRQVEDFWLHEKYLFGKLGRKGTPELYGGLIHIAQWGGYDTHRYGQIPSGFQDYWRVFFGMAGEEGSPDQFQVNRYGNSLGSWQAGLIWRFDPIEVWIHKATLFEDNSGYKMRSPEDGVQGINLLLRHRTVSSRPDRRSTSILSRSDKHLRSGPGSITRDGTQPQEVLTRITWEFWHTKSQSGPGAADRPPGWQGNRDEHGHRFGGQDNYFNHGVYIEGWSYQGRLIGVPLITFDPERERVVNNRLIGHHIAVRHDLPYASLSAAWSWTRNYGTYEFPFDEALEQHYILLAWEQSLSRMFGVPLLIRLDLGVDSGRYIGNRAAALVSLSYRFL